ncbi:pilus assembly protein [Psychrobacter sp. K31L]|uniref:pilus assembly protein n=1 Tax=Psychrobacter sp. K31L TaxID=2820758 RepID=UPI001B32ED61|nr:pilus assembly protein [Psychrobacter sp. K31L]MBP3946764.1 pilus assembly protein [Psychrobacter sp. K31L]
MQLSNMRKQLGQGMTEYIIIVALIAIAAIGSFQFFGQTARSQAAAAAQELAGESGATDTANAKKAADESRKQGSAKKSMKNFNDNGQ